MEHRRSVVLMRGTEKAARQFCEQMVRDRRGFTAQCAGQAQVLIGEVPTCATCLAAIVDEGRALLEGRKEEGER